MVISAEHRETCGGVQIVSAMVKAHRAHERKSVSWNAKLHQDGCILDCKAVDVSAGGAKIRIDERLPINSWVVLSIDAVGNFPGEVRWQDKSFAGIRFLQDAAVVEERLCDALGAKIAFPHSCEAQGW